MRPPAAAAWGCCGGTNVAACCFVVGRPQERWVCPDRIVRGQPRRCVRRCALSLNRLAMCSCASRAAAGAALANFNVNATSGMVMAHHFLTEMRNKGLKGCLCFTSSPACTYLPRSAHCEHCLTRAATDHIPTPITAMYGPTKAFLTSFAMALAAEARADGIDVCVVRAARHRQFPSCAA